MSRATPVLAVSNVTKRFPGVVALRGVSLELQPGEVHAFMGENGAGKSTLVKLLTGAYAPDEGTILMDGEPVRFRTPADSQQRGIAAVYQEFAQVPTLSVMENVFLGRLPRRRGLVDWAAAERATADLLQRFKVQADPLDPLAGLGVAGRQLIEIVKAFSRAEVRVLILDEPTSALSDADTQRLFGVVRMLREQGVAIVYISHRMGEIKQICDRITVLRNGEHIGTRPARDTSVAEVVTMMLGKPLKDFFPPKPQGRGDVMLEVQDLRAPRIHGVSLRAHAGEVLGIAGLVGAGKTELLQALFGARPAMEGRITVRGVAARIACPRDAIALGIGLIPESRKEHGLVLQLSSMANISLASLGELGAPLLRPDLELAATRRHIAEVGVVPADPDALARNLSGGNQQKLVIAKWLMHGAAVLLFDEPTRGVDVGAKLQIYALIAKLALHGHCIVVASSEVEEIAGICNRVLLLRSGRLVGEFEGEDVNTEQVLAAVAQTGGH